jgi:two-component system chemotaxis response regulator CheY
MTDSTAEAKFRILLAEDDEVNQEVIRAFLANQSHIDLTVVGDGRSALEAAMATRYDLMLFDHNMPHITGDRVIRYLRSGNSGNSRTPVVRFTAEADHPRISTTAGVVEAVLPKPLRAETFLSTIDSILNRRHG